MPRAAAHTLNHDLKISPMSLVLSIGLTNAQFISPFHTNCTTTGAFAAAAHRRRRRRRRCRTVI